MNGEQKYLYRAVDSTGLTIDFLLTAKGDATGAKRFFRKAMQSPGNPCPRVINVDKNPAYPVTIQELKDKGVLSKRTRLGSGRRSQTLRERELKLLREFGMTPSLRTRVQVIREEKTEDLWELLSGPRVSRQPSVDPRRHSGGAGPLNPQFFASYDAVSLRIVRRFQALLMTDCTWAKQFQFPRSKRSGLPRLTLEACA